MQLRYFVATTHMGRVVIPAHRAFSKLDSIKAILQTMGSSDPK